MEASEVIEMADHPATAYRRKKDASITVATKCNLHGYILSLSPNFRQNFMLTYYCILMLTTPFLFPFWARPYQRRKPTGYWLYHPDNGWR
mgnify:CR=1 FL=1